MNLWKNLKAMHPINFYAATQFVDLIINSGEPATIHGDLSPIVTDRGGGQDDAHVLMNGTECVAGELLL